MGPQTANTIGALALGRILQRTIQVMAPAAQAESKGNIKLFTTSENWIGLFLVAYQT